MHAHHAFHLRVHAALVGDKPGKAGLEIGRASYIGDVIAENMFHLGDKAVRQDGLGRSHHPISGADIRYVDFAAGDRLECLAVILGCVGKPEIVDRIGQQQHVDALRPEGFQMRACHRKFGILGRQVIDRLLTLGKAVDIFLQRDHALERVERNRLMSRILARLASSSYSPSLMTRPSADQAFS